MENLLFDEEETLLEEVIVDGFIHSEEGFIYIEPYVAMYNVDQNAGKAYNSFITQLIMQNNTPRLDYYWLSVVRKTIKWLHVMIKDIVQTKYNGDYYAYVNDYMVGKEYHNILSRLSFIDIKNIIEVKSLVVSIGKAIGMQLYDMKFKDVDINAEKPLALIKQIMEQYTDLSSYEMKNIGNEADAVTIINLLNPENCLVLQALESIEYFFNHMVEQSTRIIDYSSFRALCFDGPQVSINKYDIELSTEIFKINNGGQTVVLFDINDQNDFISLLKYILNTFGLQRLIQREITEFYSDLLVLVTDALTHISEIMTGMIPNFESFTNFSEILKPSMFKYRDSEFIDESDKLSTQLECLQLLDPEMLLMHDRKTLLEAEEGKKVTRDKILKIHAKVKKFHKEFKETTDKIINDNKEWVSNAEKFNVTRVDISQFKYSMYPYWKTIDKMVTYKIPEYNQDDIGQYRSTKEFVKNNFKDLLDADGIPVYKEKFRGGMEEEIRPAKIVPTYNKCMRIIKRYPRYANAIERDLIKLLRTLKKLSNNVQQESAVDIDWLLEGTLLEDALYAHLYSGILNEGKEPYIPNESNDNKTPAEPAIDEIVCINNWFKESYKVCAAKMTVIEEAYGASIKYISDLMKATTVHASNDKVEADDNDKSNDKKENRK